MDFGVFIPIGNNGWIISKNSPQYMPSFELNKQITLAAEKHGFEFVLSMVKLRGFGGETEFWDHNLESFTLMAGLAAVTEKIKLYASTAILTLHPAMVARMAVTISDISKGRFGINIVSGWNMSEYQQMGVWPGDSHFANRYEHSSEYVAIMKDLWENGRSSFKGDFYELDDCMVQPKPTAHIPIVGAGQSDRGMQFCAEYGDYNFIVTPSDLELMRSMSSQLQEAASKTGRKVGAYALNMIFIKDTDAEAEAYVQHCKDGADTDALAFMMGMAAADVNASETSTARQILQDMQNNCMFNINVIAGSPATVARKVDEIAAIPGVTGMMFTFPDFVEGVERFGTDVMPLLVCNK